MRKTVMTLAIVGGALALAACASQPQPAGPSNQQKATAQNQKTRTVCISSIPTGSHIAKTHCVTMTTAQYDAYKKAQEEQSKKQRAKFERIQSQTGPKATGSGG